MGNEQCKENYGSLEYDNDSNEISNLPIKTLEEQINVTSRYLQLIDKTVGKNNKAKLTIELLEILQDCDILLKNEAISMTLSSKLIEMQESFLDEEIDIEYTNQYLIIASKIMEMINY